MRECTDMRCTRDMRTGLCIGLHCSFCGEPCGSMGHPACIRRAASQPRAPRDSRGFKWSTLVAQIDARAPVTHEPTSLDTVRPIPETYP